MKKLYQNISLKSLDLENRFFVPPMCTYQANSETGEFNFIHYDHYSGFAMGGFKTIIIESNAINFDGRLSENDLVLTKNQNYDLYNAMIKNVHNYGSKIGVQINHGGENSVGNKKHAKSYSENELEQIIEDFKTAIDIANESLDVDFIEIHAAHGYFLDQIVSNRHDFTWTVKRKKEIVSEILNYALSKNKEVGIRINFNDDCFENDTLIQNTWVEILSDFEEKLLYISITSSGHNREGKLYNLPLLKLARKRFQKAALISCSGIESYEDANLYDINGATLVGVGTKAFLNKNILLSWANRNDVIKQNVFTTLIRMSTKS